MADENKMRQAKTAYQTFCEVLDDEKWKYKRDDEKLSLEMSVKGDDLSFDLNVNVDAERSVVSILSKFNITLQDSSAKANMGVAISAVNNAIVNGMFDYNCVSGKIVFRMVNSYLGSIISKEVYKYMLYVACSTIDQYNDKLILLSSGSLSLDEFLKQID